MLVKTTDRIICDRCSGFDWHDKTKDKTGLFVDKDNKYDEKDPKKTAKQLKKKKLRLKHKVDK